MKNSQENSLIQSKKCSVCKVEKLLDEFHRKSEGKYGRKPECKVCASNWQKEHYSIDEIKKKRIDRQASSEYRLQQRKHHLKKFYNISIEDYERMLKSQNECCKTCKSDLPEGRNKYFHVDHCHTTGKVRGLLCPACNTALGLLKENTKTLENLIKYLKENRKGR